MESAHAITRSGLTISIRTATANDRERQCAAQLEQLLRQYDVGRWIFTRDILIQGGVIPHSHPVLTLNTRHVGEETLLLSLFLHEQIHWFEMERDEAFSAAISEFRTLYPSVPVGYPIGARDERSTYLHLIINSLEHQALEELLGVEAAREVIEHWSTDHYTWVYRQVLDNGSAIRAVLARHGLVI
jgi:hypothetical protein